MIIKNLIHDDLYITEKSSNILLKNYELYINCQKNIFSSHCNTEIKFYENYFYFIENIIKDKKLCIKNPLTNDTIITNKYFILTYPSIFKNVPNTICNYYFVEEDIVLGVDLGTGSNGLFARFMYLILFKDNIIYQLPNLDDIIINNKKINTIILDKINLYKKKIIDTDFSNIKSNINTIYCSHNNIGHHIFNDITGLYILYNSDLVKNIDNVFIGPYDFFNIKKYFVNNKNNVIDTNITDLDGVIGKGILFKYNHFFIL